MISGRIKNGDVQERTEWHRVVVWSKLAEICAQYLSKGRMVYVEGRLQTRSWEDNQGVKRYSTDVVANNVIFLSSPSQSQTSDGVVAGKGAGDAAGGSAEPDFAPDHSKGEEIPF